MLTTLANFDPVQFLEIDTSSYSPDKIRKIRKDLHSKIGEYVLVKLSENLTDEQTTELEKLLFGTQIFNFLKNNIPDTEFKMLQVIEDFKKDYQELGKD